MNKNLFLTNRKNKIYYIFFAFLILIFNLICASALAFDFNQILEKGKNLLNQNSNNNSNFSQLYSKEQLSSDDFWNCRQFFINEKPLILSDYPPSMKMKALCSDEFAVLHSGATRTPIMVFEKLNAAKINKTGKLKRTNDFYQDTRLKREERSFLEDYKSSGYDRGHLAPAGDMTTQRAMAQSFALSNMVPQNAENNRKVWNKIESDVRKYAKRAKSDVFIITGVIFTDNQILKNRVAIPSHLYKIVYDISNNKNFVYFVPNAPTNQIKPISYEEFVNITKINILNNFF